MVSSPHSSLHLCDPAIHEQLDSRDVAAVVGREEHHGLGNLVGSTEAAEWHRGGDHLRALLASLRGGEQLIQMIAATVPLDRKSTRLNSSHSSISYAVFCLKKKNRYIHLNKTDKTT